MIARILLPILIAFSFAASAEVELNTLPSCEESADPRTIKLDLAKFAYYSRKHVPPPSFLKLVSDIASSDSEVMKKASVQMAKLEKAFYTTPTVGHINLKGDIRGRIDKPLWDVFRYRMTPGSPVTRISFFRDDEELRSALEHFQKLWDQKSDEITTYQDARGNGVATFNFIKDGTTYSVSLCVKFTQHCYELGLVKTIHPLCGPHVMTLNTQRFRRVTSEIANELIPQGRERAFTDYELGYQPSPCK